MSEQLRLRGDIAAIVAAYTGPQREVVVDATNNRLVVQDGVTPGGWPAAKLTEISRLARTAIAASYSAQASDRLIAATAIVSPIYVTLPAAASFQPGARLLVIDESGAASFSRSINVSPQGSDIVAGQFSPTIAAPFGFLELESNGVGQWTMTDGLAAGLAATASLTPATTASATAAFSGQAILGLSQPLTPFSVFDVRLKSGLRPVIAPLNPFALKSGLLITTTLTGFAAGKFDALAILTTLDGKIAPAQMARALLTLDYIGA